MDTGFLKGKWIQTKTENMDGILSKMGYSWPVRTVAGAMGITLTISDTEDCISTRFDTVLKSSQQNLSFHHPVHDVGLTKNEKFIVSPITINDRTMKHSTHYETPSVSLDIKNTYERNGNKLVLTQIIDDVVGCRHFEKQE